MSINTDAVKAASAELSKAQGALNRFDAKADEKRAEFEKKLDEKRVDLEAAHEAARLKLVALVSGEVNAVEDEAAVSA